MVIKMLSIMDWNVAGELHMPKNITVSLKSPLFILKAAFHSSPFLIHMLLYPHHTSSLVKYFAPFSLSMISKIKGRGVWVLDCPIIQISVVLAGSKFSIFLIDKEKWRSHWWLRWFYVSFLQVFFEKFVQFDLFCWCEIVVLEWFWFESFLHFNLVVPRLRFRESVGLSLLKMSR